MRFRFWPKAAAVAVARRLLEFSSRNRGAAERKETSVEKKRERGRDAPVKTRIERPGVRRGKRKSERDRRKKASEGGEIKKEEATWTLGFAKKT